MNIFRKISLALVLFVSCATFCSCDSDDNTAVVEEQLTPSQLLAFTPWETTNALDNQGKSVALTDPNVANFVGFAYFKSNGTFTMYNLDDSPKMKGDWSVPADGKTRTIVAKNDAGEVLFTRVVDITVLTKKEFTYRIYPSESNKAVYFDIVHTPTTHNEPAL